MIKLSNGYEFQYTCASGALGWRGEGWWWEAPLQWMGLLKPEKFTIITKTLTRVRRKGNLNLLHPWTCVRLIPGGAVNAVGLTNPGIDWWLQHCLPKLEYHTILSIAPETTYEAEEMAYSLTRAIERYSTGGLVKAIELNVSCPNVHQEESVAKVGSLVGICQSWCPLPIIVKLAYQNPYLAICEELADQVAAFNLINTVPWNIIYPDKRSPLDKYGLLGGVSGTPIAARAVEVLRKVKAAGIKTPIISGGGIDSFEEAYSRFYYGASAVSFGTMFLRSPWAPNQVIKELDNELQTGGFRYPVQPDRPTV